MTAGKSHQDAKPVKRTKEPKKVPAACPGMTKVSKEAKESVQRELKTPSAALTPCMRLQQLLESKAHRRDIAPAVISTIEGLQEFLKGKERNKVVIHMKLMWISDHAYEQWKLVRLHFVDADAPESLEELLRVYHEPYKENSSDIDPMLLTVTMWNLECDSEFLPAPGCVVDINEYSNLQLFRDAQCQLTTRLRHMSWQRREA